MNVSHVNCYFPRKKIHLITHLLYVRIQVMNIILLIFSLNVIISSFPFLYFFSFPFMRFANDFTKELEKEDLINSISVYFIIIIIFLSSINLFYALISSFLSYTLCTLFIYDLYSVHI